MEMLQNFSCLGSLGPDGARYFENYAR